MIKGGIGRTSDKNVGRDTVPETHLVVIRYPLYMHGEYSVGENCQR